jgi:G3E family GTPase
LSEHEVSVAQAAVADHLLITKLDLVAAGSRSATRAALSARLRKINRAAPIEAVDDTGVDPIRLMRQSVPDPSQGPISAKAWLDAAMVARPEEPERGADAQQHEHEHGHEHGHDASIASFNLIREAPLPREALQLLLTSLERHLGPRLLRVKGLIHVAEEPEQPAVIQGAQHLLHNLTWLPRWPDADRRTRIVFITQGIGTEELAEMVNLLDRVAQRTAAARARAGAPAP